MAPLCNNGTVVQQRSTTKYGAAPAPNFGAPIGTCRGTRTFKVFDAVTHRQVASVAGVEDAVDGSVWLVTIVLGRSGRGDGDMSDSRETTAGRALQVAHVFGDVWAKQPVSAPILEPTGSLPTSMIHTCPTPCRLAKLQLDCSFPQEGEGVCRRFSQRQKPDSIHVLHHCALLAHSSCFHSREKEIGGLKGPGRGGPGQPQQDRYEKGG